MGCSIGGTVTAIHSDVETIAVGDRVLTDSPFYLNKKTAYGAWQKYVLSRAITTSKIGNAPFPQAVALPFALSTAAIALSEFLGMPRPGSKKVDSKEKVLVWGAGGSVGGYAVQYAKEAGFTIITTASPRSKEHLTELGASDVLDYKSSTIVQDLIQLGPFKYAITTAADVPSQKAIAEIVKAQGGGKFASVGPGDAAFPEGVERVYAPFPVIIQKPGHEDFVKWWYGTYLPLAVRGAVEPTPVDFRFGGLGSIEEAGKEIVAGTARGKVVVNPQE
jgi:NADPH:quinone reductase-like Zn-dependent oxidoreductase